MNWSEIFASIFCSVIASFCFLFLILFFLRPSIKISDDIAAEIEDEGKMCYRIKFINKSLFSCYDVFVELREQIELPAAPCGKHVYPKDLTLKTQKFSYLQGHVFKPKNYAHHCIQVGTYDKVEEILSDPIKSIQIRITLRHGLTGLSKNFIKNYQTSRCIKKGEFKFGNFLTII